MSGGDAYAFTGFGYNLVDGLTQVVYPLGRTVVAGYDSAGRLANVFGVRASGIAESYGVLS